VQRFLACLAAAGGALALAAALPSTRVTEAEEGDAVLIDCGTTSNVGDAIDRGFYADYRGSTISSVTIWMGSNDPGPYSFSLTARADSYDGPFLGISNVSGVMFDTTGENPTEVTFDFQATPVTPGVVTFAIAQTEGPEERVLYDLAEFGFDSPRTCPVTQTQGTTPPLDEVRRPGIRIRIEGQPPAATINVPMLTSDGVD